MREIAKSALARQLGGDGKDQMRHAHRSLHQRIGEAIFEEVRHAVSPRYLMGKRGRGSLVFRSHHLATPHGDSVAHAASGKPSRDYCEAHGLKLGKFDLSRLAIITWTTQYAHLRGGAWFAKHAGGATVALTSNSARVHLAACKAGAGVAILPSRVADRDPDLMCLLRPEQVLSLDLFLVVHRDLLRTTRIRAVMEFLADLAPKRA